MLRSVMPYIGVVAVIYMVAADITRPRSGVAIVHADGVDDIPVANDRETLSLMARSGQATGSYFRISNDSSVTVLHRSSLACEIRTNEGRHGWVFSDWVSSK